ncbi:neuropeptide FF receptor 2-like [Lytechinus variegatus]|uniref:neuropeptide FF receptor 2-like n=1 Tax=Lytechinus variegatus TaxID=7654 RepID=UPI001BB14CA5|nr:neuropeptide FF receptor 2-like [Lytechinus variegatus]
MAVSNITAAVDMTVGHQDQGIKVTVLRIIQASLLGVCLVMILISNTIIIVILTKVKNCFEDMQQLVFKALAITDVFTGVFCCGTTIMAIVIGDGQWFSSTLCAVRGVACTGLVNLSALLIAFACIDRFVAVVYPLHYFSFVTIKRTRITIVILIGLAISNGALSLLRGRTVARENLCLSDFSSERLAFRPSLVTSLLLSGVSLTIATVTNIKVMMIALGQSKRSAKVTPSEEVACNEANIKTPRGSLKGLYVLVVATITFFMAIFPWSIVSASQFSKKSTIATPMARYVTSLLVISKSWMNALIFVTLNKRFRRATKAVVFGGHRDDQGSSITQP